MIIKMNVNCEKGREKEKPQETRQACELALSRLTGLFPPSLLTHKKIHEDFACSVSASVIWYDILGKRPCHNSDDTL